MVKLPGASTLLPIKYDTMGRPIRKYGKETNQSEYMAKNFVNIFFSPANVNVEQNTPAGKEVYKVYQATEDKSVFPKSAPYIVKMKSENKNLTTEQISQWQKESGKMSQKMLNDMIADPTYKNKSAEVKAEMLAQVINYSYNYAKEKVTGIVTAGQYTSMRNAKAEGINAAKYTLFQKNIDDTDSDTRKRSTIEFLTKANLTNKQKGYLYSKTYAETTEVLNSNINMNSYLDLQLRIKDIEADIDPKSKIEGKTISGSKKIKVLKEINNTQGLTPTQKVLMIYLSGYSVDNNDIRGITKNGARRTVYQYVNQLRLTKAEKKDILDKAGYKIFKNGRIGW
jgi:hypothetical protein